MSWFDKLKGGLKIAAGVASEVVAPGNPEGIGLAAGGVGDIVSKPGGASGGGAPSKESGHPQPGPNPKPPITFPSSSASFDAHREDRRNRVAQSYPNID